MDRLTAVRTFAKPSYCPAKRTRIFADRWYKVTFQNVETDPRCDYVGLGEGEYTVLLPGHKARNGRDAKLNHCNHIEEWNGSVYALYTTRYGSWNSEPMHYADLDSIHAAIKLAYAIHEKWLADVRKEKALAIAALIAKPSETWRQGTVRDCERCLTERSIETFAYHLDKVR